MTAQQQYTLTGFQSLFEMLNAVDAGDPGEFCRIPEPRNAQFQQADPVSDEGLSHQGCLLRFCQFRKTQPDIHFRDVAAASGNFEGEESGKPAQPPL